MESTQERLPAQVGDLVVIHGHRLGEPERLGEIIEVFGDQRRLRLRVRWEDQHESIFYPGSDASVRAHRPREVKNRGRYN